MLTLKINSDPLINQVELVSECIRKLCTLTPLDYETIEEINLCVVESVNNAVEHSYANQSGKEVQVKIDLQPDCLILDIIDTGIGLKDGKLPDIKLNEVDPKDIQNLPEGGWGLYIILNAVDEMDYFREGQTNTLKLCKHFSSQVPS